VGSTPFWIEVFDQGSGTLVAICGSGSSCVGTVSQPTAIRRSYIAFVADSSSSLPPPDIRATSNTQIVDWVVALPSTAAFRT
jgi:hypothetical protein